MWRTLRAIADERGLSRVTLQQVASGGKMKKPSVLGDAVRQDGSTWLIDDEHPVFVAWLQRHWEQARVTGNTYIIKAAGPGPSFVEIRRAGTSLSDFHDERNHMLLSEVQEEAYQQAYLLVKQNKRYEALAVLEPHFDKAWIES